MLKMFRKGNQKGFTLIELLIVVAIIGILAAIAIPQFAAYRTRGFNASAQSDVRNLATSQAALYSDWQSFGGTAGVGQANPLVFGAFAGGGGAVITGPNAGAGNVPVIQTIAQGGNRGIQIPLGNNVMIVSSTEGAGLYSTFVGVTKHVNGNTYFGVDGNTTATFFAEDPGSEGDIATFAAGSEPASTTADDFSGGNCPGGQAWVVK